MATEEELGMEAVELAGSARETQQVVPQLETQRVETGLEVRLRVMNIEFLAPEDSAVEVRALVVLELEVEVGTVEVHQAFLAVPVAAAASVQHPLQAAPR